MDPELCQRIYDRIRAAVARFEKVELVVSELARELGRSERQVYRMLRLARLKALERGIALRPDGRALNTRPKPKSQEPPLYSG